MPDDEFRGWPSLDPNAYDPLSNPNAHYSRELLAVEWPKLASASIDDPSLLWTSKTKRLVKRLLDKLGAQENMLAKLNDEERIQARMDFEIECITTSAMCHNVDIDADFLQLMRMIKDCALIVFSRSQEGWERILQATTIRRIEESQLAQKQEAEKKKGLMEKIVGGAKAPEENK